MLNRLTLKFQNPQLEERFLRENAPTRAVFNFYIIAILLPNIAFLILSIISKEIAFTFIFGFMAIFLLIFLVKTKREYIHTSLGIISMTISILMIIIEAKELNQSIWITDIWYSISVFTLISHNFLFDMTCYGFFIFGRCYVQNKNGFQLMTVFYLILSMFFVLRNYQRISHIRQMYIYGQMNQSYEGIINFISTDAVIGTTFDKYQLKFSDCFRNSISQLKYPERGNEIFKKIKLIKQNVSLQTYLFNLAQKNVTDCRSSLQGFYADSRQKLQIHYLIYTIQETYFYIKIINEQKQKYTQSPLYRELLGELGKMNTKKSKRIQFIHLFKNLLILINRTKIEIEYRMVDIKVVKQILNLLGSGMRVDSKIRYLYSDYRLLALFLKISKACFLKISQTENNDIYEFIFISRERLNQKQLQLLNLIWSYIGIGEINYQGSQKYQCLLLCQLQLYQSFKSHNEISFTLQ